MSVGSKAPIIVGRYALFDAIASGGMATVHLGRLMGEVGFSRTVAIKRLHSQHAMDPEFVSMFIDEARLAARVRHPNVVQTLDVGAENGELFVVMDYIEGEPLSRMFRLAVESGIPIEPRIVSRVVTDTLQGLHAAHDAKAEDGAPLDIVHRDVSPQNVLVGTDGISRVLDFGIAKASGRGQTTREGQIKGKLAYMAPEQLMAAPVTRRTDVFAAGIVLWELLTGRRLFSGASEGEIVKKVLDMPIPVVTHIVPTLPREIEAVLARALARNPEDRFRSAAEFADALDAAIPPATARTVGEWVRSRAETTLLKRAQLVADIERSSSKNIAGAAAASALRASDPTIVEGAESKTRTESVDIPIDLATAHATTRSITTPDRPSRGKLVGAGAGVTLLALGAVAVFAATRRSPPPPPAPASTGPAAVETAPPPASPAPPASSGAEAARAPDTTVTPPAPASASAAPVASAPKGHPPTQKPGAAVTKPGGTKADTKPGTPATTTSAAPAAGGGLYTRD